MIAVAFAPAACVAPPMGLGRGAVTSSSDTAASLGAAALDEPSRPIAIPRAERQIEPSAPGPQRQVMQLDIAMNHTRDGSFSDDVGGALTYLRDTRGNFSGLGVLPYWRPRFQLGNFSVATAMSAALLAGGEEGMVAAFLDVQVAYGTRDWGVYGGSYAHGCLMTGGPIVAAGQARVGAEYMLDLGTSTRVGLAVELYRQLDLINVVDGDGSPAFTSNLRGAGVKLRLELP